MREKGTDEELFNSSWKICYWFSRMLVNTDRYAGLGRNEKLMDQLLTKIEPLILLDNLTEKERYKTARDALMNELRRFSEGTSKISINRRGFCDELEKMICSLDDLAVLMFTIRYIVLPSNAALKRVPSNDKKFCTEQAGAILHSLGKKGVGKALAVWDTLGERICLNIEREEITAEFTKLRNVLESLKTFQHNIIDDNVVMTAFVQEFERRSGQKRKSRAGKGLEEAVTFLFDFYGLKSHPKPEHFQTDIEIDKWFKCHDGWLIGISCKRTLRERWKQVSGADKDTLSRYKIREIWHLMTYDRDLSDDKITMLGQQRHVFYLDDESERYITASKHKGMKDYVRPLTKLVDDIEREQKFR